MGKYKSKVAVYHQNGLGNFVMLTPALVMLSEHFDTTLDLILSSDWVDSRKEQTVDIAQKWDRIDRVIEAATKGDPYLITRDSEPIYKDDYDFYYASGHNTNSPIMEWFGIFGGDNPWERASWKKSLRHEVAHHANEVYKNVKYRGPIPDPEMPLADTPVLPKKKRMRIALCNGSARSDTFMWEKKRWWGFPIIADLLKRYYDAEIHFVGRGEDDALDARRVKQKVPEMVDWVKKDLMITQTAKVVAQCDLLVTSDTSVMHVGAAVGTPVVALFGPTLASKNRPWTKKAVVAKSPVQCSPCQYHFMFQLCDREEFKYQGQKYQSWRCMRHIYPERVMRVIRDFWGKMERTVE